MLAAAQGKALAGVATHETRSLRLILEPRRLACEGRVATGTVSYLPISHDFHFRVRSTFLYRSCASILPPEGTPQVDSDREH